MLRILRNIVFIIIVAIAMYFYGNITFLNNKIFNLLTVDTVLVGFLFTTLGILLSKTEEKTLEAYIANDEFKKIYNNIIMGVICGLLSIFVSILGYLVFGDVDKKDINIMVKCWYSIDIALFMRILLSMVITIIKMHSILEDIFKKKKNEILQNDANKSMDNRFNTNYYDDNK